MNFTWWVNRQDIDGRNVFSRRLPRARQHRDLRPQREVAAGLAYRAIGRDRWMAVYSLDMMASRSNWRSTTPRTKISPSKFFEHFLYIANAINNVEGTETGLWDETDGFYYDQVIDASGKRFPMKVHSLVGMLPMLAVDTIQPQILAALTELQTPARVVRAEPSRVAPQRRVHGNLRDGAAPAARDPRSRTAPRLLRVLLDENEFLSPHGIRSVSRYHAEHPYVISFRGQEFRVDYEPAESTQRALRWKL